MESHQISHTIIVLGFRTKKNGQPNLILKSRLDKALDLSKELIIKKMIVTGSAVHNQFVEAEVMKKYLVENGIPEEKIILENQARNTVENAQYSLQIVSKYHLENVIVITSPYHKKRTKIIFDQFFKDYQLIASNQSFATTLNCLPKHIGEYVTIYKNRNNKLNSAQNFGIVK